jgi:predicted RNA-binding Zn ribbon-like protein
MTGSSPNLTELHLDGGRLALDFVNTVDPREGPEPKVDHLPDYRALVAWSAYAGHPVADPATAGDRATRAIHRRAIALREALYRIVRAVATGDTPAQEDLETLSREHARAVARLHLDRTATAWVPRDKHDPERPLTAVVVSAVEVLTREDPTRLRWCPPEHGGCGWVAYDDTRNRSRRWCSMATCGAEVKARRLTERRRQERRA